jgi:hypothetical protein
MTLPVDENLFNLLAAHEYVRANPAREVGIEEDAIWLHTDMGPSFYLTRSGRILTTDALTPDIAPREATPHETAAALVLGARNLAACQLLDLLPPRPTNAVDCIRCHGTRWWSIRDLEGMDTAIICPDCSGRGWTV